MGEVFFPELMNTSGLNYWNFMLRKDLDAEGLVEENVTLQGDLVLSLSKKKVYKFWLLDTNSTSIFMEKIKFYTRKCVWIMICSLE